MLSFLLNACSTAKLFIPFGNSEPLEMFLSLRINALCKSSVTSTGQRPYGSVSNQKTKWECSDPAGSTERHWKYCYLKLHCFRCAFAGDFTENKANSCSVNLFLFTSSSEIPNWLKTGFCVVSRITVMSSFTLGVTVVKMEAQEVLVLIGSALGRAGGVQCEGFLFL